MCVCVRARARVCVAPRDMPFMCVSATAVASTMAVIAAPKLSQAAKLKPSFGSFTHLTSVKLLSESEYKYVIVEAMWP